MSYLAAGDMSALAALIRRHQQHLLELAYRVIGDRALAEDIAQETFVRIWRSAARYKPTAKFTTFLHRIVVNLCLDARKARKRYIPGAVLPDAVDARAPSAGLEATEHAKQIQRAVAALPERQRVAVVLHRFSNLSLKDVADVTGWTGSAVESLLVRAYATLRVALQELDQK